jgi:flagellar biosynthesis GTPase FlhF
MKKRHYVALVIVLSVILLAAALWWLTERILPNVGIVHLTPLGKEVHPLPQYGSAILVFNNSKIDGHRVIESIKIGWAGLWPFITVGIIFGAISGYVIGYSKGCRKGFPDREFVDFARKSLAHSTELARIADVKESNAARKLSKSKNMDAKSRQRDSDSANACKEASQKSDEADKRMVIAQGKLRDAEAIEKELDKAQAKIRRLEGRMARHEKKKQKPIDESDEED